MTAKPFRLAHISHSAAHQYLECGERYRLERVEGHRGPPHLAGLGGSAFHEWTEGFDALDRNLPWQPEVFIEIFERLVDEAMDTWGLLKTEDLTHSKGEGFAEWNELGQELAYKYSIWRSSNPSWRVQEIELGYTQDLGLSVPAVGFIDREFLVDFKHVGTDIPAGEHRILVDLKSNKRMPNTPQLFEYAAIRRLQGVHIDGVCYYNARKGETTPIIDPTPWTTKWLQEYYGHVIGKIQLGEFKANPGFQCSYCSVRDICEFRQEKK